MHGNISLARVVPPADNLSMDSRTGLSALATSTLIASTAAAKGVVIEMSHAREKAAPETSRLFLDGQRCRVDAQDHQVIFRADRGVMWVIEPGKDSFMEITKEDIQAAGAAMSEAMEQMRAQMAALPAEQREAMEHMMTARGMPKPGQAAVRAEYKANGKNEKVNGFATTGYDALRDGKRDAELWVAKWKDVDLTLEDFTCFEMIKEMLKSMPGGGRATMPFAEKFGEGGLPGVPVRTVRTNLQGQLTEEILRVSRSEIPGETFDEPRGKTKQTMADMMKGHAGPHGSH